MIALILLPKLTPEEDPSGALLCPNYSYDSTKGNPDPKINPKNQLPPVVQVTMVAVDEPSYNRVFPPGAPMPDFGLDNMFHDAAGASGGGGYVQELNVDLPKTLRLKGLVWRVFTTNVSIRAAKWSRDQTDTATP